MYHKHDPRWFSLCSRTPSRFSRIALLICALNWILICASSRLFDRCVVCFSYALEGVAKTLSFSRPCFQLSFLSQSLGKPPNHCTLAVKMCKFGKVKPGNGKQISIYPIIWKSLRDFIRSSVTGPLCFRSDETRDSASAVKLCLPLLIIQVQNIWLFKNPIHDNNVVGKDFWV